VCVSPLLACGAGPLRRVPEQGAVRTGTGHAGGALGRSEPAAVLSRRLRRRPESFGSALGADLAVFNSMEVTN